MRLLTLVVCCAITCLGCNDPVATTKTPTADDERAHPANYLKVNFEVHKNLVGKKVIEGTVMHTGKYLTYKTVTLRIDCYKGGNNNPVPYTLVAPLKPGMHESFKFKPESNPDKVKVSISEATVD